VLYFKYSTTATEEKKNVLTVFARKIIIENAFAFDHTTFAVEIN
jgi:hypothetical protein